MGLLFRLASLGFLIVVAGVPRSRRPAVEFRTGDIVLQTSKSSRSLLIQRASRSKYSHVGLVEVSQDGVFVIEAISPVSRTPLARWAARGVGHRLTVLRPKSMSDAALARTVQLARQEVGKPYDARFRWDDESLYCSELVVKAFERGAGVTLGRQQHLEELALSDEERALAHQAGLSDEQTLVTPASLDGDEHLSVLARDLEWPVISP